MRAKQAQMELETRASSKRTGERYKVGARCETCNSITERRSHATQRTSTARIRIQLVSADLKTGSSSSSSFNHYGNGSAGKMDWLSFIHVRDDIDRAIAGGDGEPP